MYKRCIKCGFILGTRPGMFDNDGICGACINAIDAASFDWETRKNDLRKICENLKSKNKDYDCLIAVSGGKDSTVIVKTLANDYKIKPLLVTVTDEFTHTQAGINNVKNIAERFNCDHLIWRCEPETFKRKTLMDFENELHPLKWVEEKIYSIPIMLAKSFGIEAVFFGENSAFEYGCSKTLDYLHPASEDQLKVYYLFSFLRYSETGNRKIAKEYGFKDLDDFNEWQRHGNIENYTQQDSIAYIIQLWTKYVKFGFQRVSDMACRYVRHGLLTREQALQYIADRDYQCDPAAKKDFCKTLGITEEHFDLTVDKHANLKLVEKDVNGIWKVKW